MTESQLEFKVISHGLKLFSIKLSFVSCVPENPKIMGKNPALNQFGRSMTHQKLTTFVHENFISHLCSVFCMVMWSTNNLYRSHVELFK